MKTPHILRVSRGPDSFSGLFRSLDEEGLRYGWLEYSEVEAPPSLAAAAAHGALRAVSVGEAGSVVVKPRRGAAVLKDLLREHFRGCALVLLRGSVAAPELIEADQTCRLCFSDGTSRTLSTESFVSALRRVSPWPQA